MNRQFTEGKIMDEPRTQKDVQLTNNKRTIN